MKQCPACRRQFPDDLKFCLEDGSVLAGLPDEVETRYIRVSQPTGRSGVLTFAVGLALFLGVGLVLAGAGIGGYLYFVSRSTNWFPAPTPTPPGATPYPSPTLLQSPTATPWQTRTPSKAKEEDLRTVDPSTESGKKPVPKQISGGVLNGKATSLPKPPYPPAARAVRASGTVAVQVLVDEYGSVVSASAVSGHPLLRAAAVSAARGARFAPTMLSGQAVKVSGVITYNFVPPD